MSTTVYLIETPKEIFWSHRKLDAQYKHLDFLYKDRARYKEMAEEKFNNYVKHSGKKIIKLEEVQ